jgi:hypothetical protein
MKKSDNPGRPPKFEEPSRPITATLPLRTLDLLEAVDKDRAKAIVKSVDAVMSQAQGVMGMLEIVQVSKESALIVVGPSRSLARIPWLRLVEIAPTRFLLAVPTGTSVDSLEVAIMDLIESLSEDEVDEKEFLLALRHHLSRYRRNDGVTKGEILFLNTRDSK